MKHPTLKYRVIVKFKDGWPINGEKRAMRGTAIKSPAVRSWRIVSVPETSYCHSKLKMSVRQNMLYNMQSHE